MLSVSTSGLIIIALYTYIASRIICEIASFIDLNTLDNLSRTCRQTRENLLQFRKQLITRTLRCSNDDVVPNSEHTLRYRARAADWYFVEEGAANVMGKSRFLCQGYGFRVPAVQSCGVQSMRILLTTIW